MDEANPITRALLSAMVQSREPMALTDPALPDHPIVAVNAAFVALSGYDEAQIVGRNCRFLQGAGTDRATTLRIRQCIAERRGCIEWILNYRQDGTKFWNLLFLSPVVDAAGNLLHYFGNQRDITHGPPAGLPDYVLGKADLNSAGQKAFDALMREMAEATPGAADEAGLALALERAIETGRRLNDATMGLAPADWSPPAGG